MKLTSEQERLWRYIDNQKGKAPMYSTQGLFSMGTIKALLKREIIAENKDIGCYGRGTEFYHYTKL